MYGFERVKDYRTRNGTHEEHLFRVWILSVHCLRASWMHTQTVCIDLSYLSIHCNSEQPMVARVLPRSRSIDCDHWLRCASPALSMSRGQRYVNLCHPLTNGASSLIGVAYSLTTVFRLVRITCVHERVTSNFSNVSNILNMPFSFLALYFYYFRAF